MKYYLLITGVLLLMACTKKITCEEAAEFNRQEECIAVVESTSLIVFYKINGYNPYTKKPCECNTDNRWWMYYDDYIAKGDTIIKKKGEASFNIHKTTGKRLRYYWECEGKVYK